MDPEKIDRLDREFIEKLDCLRIRLTERQAGATRKKIFFGPFGLLILVLIVAVGLYTRRFLQKPTAPPATLAPQTAGPAAPIVGRGDRLPADPPESGKGLAAQPAETTIQPPDGQRSPLPPSPTAAPVPDAVPAAGNMPAQAAEPGDAIRVASTVVCSGVHRRRPSDEKKVFQISPTTRAFVWTDVRAASVPHLIEHIYYLNGMLYCKVPLEIRFPRMRTWSSVALQQTGLSGDWRVDIRCEGRILKSIHFGVLQ
jgi:Protein of unknown function (DUF2914)